MTYAFLHTTVHNNEIYGNIVGYLRANRITPPSTEMIQEMIKAKKTPEQMFKEMMDRYNKKPLAEEVPSADPIQREQLPAHVLVAPLLLETQPEPLDDAGVHVPRASSPHSWSDRNPSKRRHRFLCA